MRVRFALLATAAAAAALPALAAAQEPPRVCLGDPTGSGVPMLPGPPVRWGITPAGEAGALGPRVEPAPIDQARTLAALDRLRPASAPFVLRLNRFFWSQGRAGIERFAELAGLYTRSGYLVELQLRYHPRPDQEGDIPAWLGFVRRVVERFGPNPGVVGLQVANEVNLYPIVPDASDSAYARAREALVRGVTVAGRETERLGYEHLEVGFNWFWRTDPARERSFWEELRDRGGERFAAAVDWVGLDAYPGTVFPPLEPPGGERDGMVAAVSQLRECFMPIAGLGADVPIHVEENGWPTGPGRPASRQAEALRAMVRAVHDFRATYNVTDYRWFDLRDHRSSSANFQHHYGLLRDDYAPKPAFGVYRSMLGRLAG